MLGTILTACLVSVGYIMPGITPTVTTCCLHSLRSRPAPSWSWIVVIMSLGIWSSTSAAGELPRASVMGSVCTLADMPIEPSLNLMWRSPGILALAPHEAGMMMYWGWMRAPVHVWAHICVMLFHVSTDTSQGIVSLVTSKLIPMSASVATGPPGAGAGVVMGGVVWRRRRPWCTWGTWAALAERRWWLGTGPVLRVMTTLELTALGASWTDRRRRLPM
mmetsp:Transcript_33330/g.78068  ORF Transcript_33330/g.78068 Transcript_33330/m.78068 type:complete len:219 (+) Transcript_33330:1172-1828(+)